MASATNAVNKFHCDVEDKVREMSAPEPGKMMAFDWSKVQAGLVVVDNAFQKVLPVVDTLTPAQYAIYVDLAAGLLHGFVTGNIPTLNPGP